MTISNGQTNSTLVVLHLYYIDMWPYFEEKLKKIADHDLIVTIPREKKSSTPESLLSRGNTKIYYYQNRGRDMLPFFSALKKTDLSAYSAILKLHTKKSPHFDNGSGWLDDMVDSLFAIDTRKCHEIFRAGAALIGPAGYFYSLVVNFEANGKHIDKLMRLFVSKSKQHDMTQVNRSSFGFFAGSMFWIQPDYMKYLLENIPTSRWRFAREKGQIDGTYAHGIERIISLVAEAEARELYSVDATGVTEKVDYSNGTIPEWSEHYTK